MQLTFCNKLRCFMLQKRAKNRLQWVSHGKCQDHCDQRLCKFFQDWGKFFFSLSIRCFVVNEFLSQFYVLCGEFQYLFLFYIRVILTKKTASSLNLPRIILLRACDIVILFFKSLLTHPRYLGIGIPSVTNLLTLLHW